MNVLNTEYYGDDFRWFVATVIDNSPPYGLEGRIQVRVHGIHSRDINDIPQGDLPWAQVMTPSDTFGGSGLGTHCQILPGSLVFGMFLDGKHSQLPMVLGSLPRVEYPSSVQASGSVDIAAAPFSYVFQQSNSQLQDPVFYSPVDPENTSAPGTISDVARFFIDNGFTAKQACSIVGILNTVSGLDPKFNSSNGEFGLAGWVLGSPRYARMNAFLSRLTPTRSIEDFDGQLMYVLQELRTTKSTAYSQMNRLPNIVGGLLNTSFGQTGTMNSGERGNDGQVAALVKFYLQPTRYFDQASAENEAIRIYKSLGAR